METKRRTESGIKLGKGCFDLSALVTGFGTTTSLFRRIREVEEACNVRLCFDAPASARWSGTSENIESAASMVRSIEEGEFDEEYIVERINA